MPEMVCGVDISCQVCGASLPSAPHKILSYVGHTEGKKRNLAGLQTALTAANETLDISSFKSMTAT